MRPITQIALIGIGAAIVCLPLAATLHDWDSSSETRSSSRERGGSDWWSWSDDWDGFGADNSALVTRPFTWSGDDSLQLDVPAEVHFHPAAAWSLSIHGHSDTLDRLRVEQGRIRLRPRFYRRIEGLQIELSGPALRQVKLNGSGKIRLDGIQQDKLQLEIRGSADADASGSVGALKIRIAGSGNARLTPLQVKSAEVSIAGSGDADINCSDSVQVFIAGSGNVRLHSHPRQLHSRIAGSGEIIEVSDGQTT